MCLIFMCFVIFIMAIIDTILYGVVSQCCRYSKVRWGIVTHTYLFPLIVTVVASCSGAQEYCNWHQSRHVVVDIGAF
jgi:hypothetical protein